MLMNSLGRDARRLELVSLRAAARDGWLTLIPGMGDFALTRWQRRCERFASPFAVLRIEPQRTSIWLILPDGHEWTGAAQGVIRAAMAGATSFVMTLSSVRAIFPLGDHTGVMLRLIAAETSSAGDRMSISPIC
jgi:hypothetical protein